MQYQIGIASFFKLTRIFMLYMINVSIAINVRKEYENEI